jgi:hypothetical protein
MCRRRHHASEVQQFFSTCSLGDVSWGRSPYFTCARSLYNLLVERLQSLEALSTEHLVWVFCSRNTSQLVYINTRTNTHCKHLKCKEISTRWDPRRNTRRPGDSHHPRGSLPMKCVSVILKCQAKTSTGRVRRPP